MLLIGRGLIQYGRKAEKLKIKSLVGERIHCSVLKAWPFSLIILEVILDSSMVEHSAVNRVVVGSSPTQGVKTRRCGTNKAPWSSG